MQKVIKLGKDLEKMYQTKLQNCEHDFELEKTLKKHKNYCNKLLKMQSEKKKEKILQALAAQKTYEKVYMTYLGQIPWQEKR